MNTCLGRFFNFSTKKFIIKPENCYLQQSQYIFQQLSQLVLASSHILDLTPRGQMTFIFKNVQKLPKFFWLTFWYWLWQFRGSQGPYIECPQAQNPDLTSRGQMTFIFKNIQKLPKFFWLTFWYWLWQFWGSQGPYFE